MKAINFRWKNKLRKIELKRNIHTIIIKTFLKQSFQKHPYKSWTHKLTYMFVKVTSRSVLLYESYRA